MSRPRTALCLEQTLGHRAHTLNLVAEAERRGNSDVVRVDYPEGSRLPVPWAVRGSLQAIRRLRERAPHADVTLFHTSTISLAASQADTPYVVSVDATPLQVDTMGHWYRHRRMPDLAESAKRAWYRRVFVGARAMIAWSDWSAKSLAADYGVDPAKVVVAHPGASRSFFSIQRREGPVPTILFVGGDFERKGGDDLLAAFSRLSGRARLLLVTGARVLPRDGVEVLGGVTPGSPELLDAYARADVFCLPTRGDCTSVAIEEAMAAGLPVVTTPVGSNPDTVTEGANGYLVEPGDVETLTQRLAALVENVRLRQLLGACARETARAAYDAEANARLVLDTVEVAA